MKKRKKKEGTTRVSRGWQLQFVYATFFPPRFFFTTKVNVTNGRRSIGLNDLVLWKLVLSPKEDRNPADEGEIAGTGIEGETFEGIEEDRTNETGTVGKVVTRFVISSESASREAIFRKIDLQRRARKVIFF